MRKPVIAIVGRPNVGKSTLFNRLLKQRLAIEDDTPGVTRDRLYRDMEWNGIPFTLVDTGGLMTRAQEEMDTLVSKAAEAAIEQADRVVFVVDGRVEVTDLDVEIARLVQRHNRPVILAVTKIDSPHLETSIYDFYSLGLGDPLAVSGISGMNTGDLLDLMVEGLESTGQSETDTDTVNFAVLGRPNVGKSSLVNRLLGEDRQIVSDIPGTTRDAIDHTMKYMGKQVVLVDTAGLLRKDVLGRGEQLDYYTSLRTMSALERCDVAAVLVDAVEGLTQYERRLIDEVRQKGKGLIVVFNKWDLVEKDSYTMNQVDAEYLRALPDLAFAPRLFISAMTGQRSRALLDKALQVHAERLKRIPTSTLNDFIHRVTEKVPPPAIKGKWLKIKYSSQVAVAPPLFTFFLGSPELMPEHYKRYLENRLREEYGFEGVPMKVVFRKK